MLPFARIWDAVSGICYAHEKPSPYIGQICTGFGTINCNNLKGAHMGSLVLGCHISTVAGGSITVLGENKNVARATDPVIGSVSANIINGSPNIFVEN